jgi:AcrR family transcriptional regulator
MEMPPLRADARENRRRILEAADTVFLERGPQGSTEEVAARAAVGIATVFRHFPTKRDLLEEVVARRFELLAVHADECLAAADPAFFSFVETVVADAPGKVALGELLIAEGGGEGRAEEAARALRERFARLLARAQEVGGVRTDVQPEEAWALVVATARAATRLQPSGVARVIEVLAAGLRPPAA